MSTSEMPQASLSSSRLAARLLTEEDLAFLEMLKSAGRLGELDDEELLRIASEVSERDADGRRAELLELYFGAAGDAATSAQRRVADRFFLQRVGDPATAAMLVANLLAVAPEIQGAVLEKMGGDDGPLVLRSGEHFAAVLDEYEEETDTDQYDVEEAEARRADVQMVTVRGLVRSVNVLLDKAGVRERLIGVRGDLERECYLALGVTDAMTMADRGFLEDENAEDVMELAAW